MKRVIAVCSMLSLSLLLIFSCAGTKPAAPADGVLSLDGAIKAAADQLDGKVEAGAHRIIAVSVFYRQCYSYSGWLKPTA